MADIDFSKFENKDPIQQTVEPTIMDKLLGVTTQPVGEFIRDNINESVGSYIQPRTTVRDGKRLGKENKTFNTLSKEELDTELTDLTAKEGEESDGVLYKLRNPDTGEVKYGRAGDDVWK